MTSDTGVSYQHGATGFLLRVYGPYRCLRDGCRIWVCPLRLFCLSCPVYLTRPPSCTTSSAPLPPWPKRRSLETSWALAPKRMATTRVYTETKTVFETRISMWTRSRWIKMQRRIVMSCEALTCKHANADPGFRLAPRGDEGGYPPERTSRSGRSCHAGAGSKKECGGPWIYNCKRLLLILCGHR